MLYTPVGYIGERRGYKWGYLKMQNSNLKIRARLRRLVGQAQSLESLLERDSELFVVQLEAVIAASRSLLAQFLLQEIGVLDEDKLTAQQKRLARIIKKLG